MRYIILNKNISKKEIKSRKKYIEKVTGMYFISYQIAEGIEFKSIPSEFIDCIFIVGHNMDVEEYLENNNIPEEYIVVVSCTFYFKKRKYKEKKIYVSYDENGKTYYYNGKDWNLNFNVSKEELKLINSYGPFIDKVNKYFRRKK